jgi:cytochrome c553
MKPSTVIIATLAVLGGFGPASAEEEATRFGKDFADRNCAWCHGPSLQGYATAPRIAGQTRQYIQSQLQSFANHARDNPLSRQYMWRAPVHLPPSAAQELAAYIASLPPRPANDGDERLYERGRALYFSGHQQANIPACAACHGPQAQGAGAIPRLAGLSYDYLRRRLKQWAQGYHAAAGPPMPGISTEMSSADIDAMASYLSFLK